MARKKSKTPQKTNPWRWPSPWWKNNPWINLTVICLAVFSVSCSEKEQSAEENFQQAQKSFNEGNYEEYYRLYRKAAEQGHADAQTFVGSWYEWGDLFAAVEKDHKQAVEWYRKAAEQGDDYGQLLLGKVYFKGKGVSQDYDKAAEWYLKSAAQGRAGALYELAVMYENGYGVKRNLPTAYALMLLAVKEGWESARDNTNKLKKDLTTEQIMAGQKIARKWEQRIEANKKKNP